MAAQAMVLNCQDTVVTMSVNYGPAVPSSVYSYVNNFPAPNIQVPMACAFDQLNSFTISNSSHFQQSNSNNVALLDDMGVETNRFVVVWQTTYSAVGDSFVLAALFELDVFSGSVNIVVPEFIVNVESDNGLSFISHTTYG